VQVRQLVLSCPAVLAEKPLELQRKVDFLNQVGVAHTPQALWDCESFGTFALL
jgi:hypothetical protein